MNSGRPRLCRHFDRCDEQRWRFDSTISSYAPCGGKVKGKQSHVERRQRRARTVEVMAERKSRGGHVEGTCGKSWWSVIGKSWWSVVSRECRSLQGMRYGVLRVRMRSSLEACAFRMQSMWRSCAGMFINVCSPSPPPPRPGSPPRTPQRPRHPSTRPAVSVWIAQTFHHAWERKHQERRRRGRAACAAVEQLKSRRRRCRMLHLHPRCSKRCAASAASGVSGVSVQIEAMGRLAACHARALGPRPRESSRFRRHHARHDEAIACRHC